ncbi:hypothetical protein P9112_007512 [Eukaryota sp. TZLM1-RC]
MFEEYKSPLLPQKPKQKKVLIAIYLFLTLCGTSVGYYSVAVEWNWHHIPHVIVLSLLLYGSCYATLTLKHQKDNIPVATVLSTVLGCCLLLTITSIWLTFFEPEDFDLKACHERDKNKGRMYATKDGACLSRCNGIPQEVLVVHNDDNSLSRCIQCDVLKTVMFLN